MRFELVKKAKKKRDFSFEPQQTEPKEQEKGLVLLSVAELVKELKEQGTENEKILLAVKVLEHWNKKQVLNPSDIVKYKNYILSLKGLKGF